MHIYVHVYVYVYLNMYIYLMLFADQKRKEMAYEEQEYIQPDNNSEPEDNNFNERTVDDNSFHAKAD